MKLNLPNKLTILRIFLVPVFMVLIMLDEGGSFWLRLAAAVVFIITALTDTLDGRIARKRNLITDFGKYLDPIADKIMVIGALLAVLGQSRGDDIAFRWVLTFALLIVVTRELAVTSMRLVVLNKSNEVIAASILGKIKTVTQMVAIIVMLFEPLIVRPEWGIPARLFSYIGVAAMAVFTAWSGADYLKKYWKFIDTNM